MGATRAVGTAGPGRPLTSEAGPRDPSTETVGRSGVPLPRVEVRAIVPLAPLGAHSGRPEAVGARLAAGAVRLDAIAVPSLTIL